jgi:hypothetical protein
MPNQAKFFFIDEDGVEASMNQWTDSNDPANLADLVAALRALSCAGLARYGILRKGEPAPAIPAAGPNAYDVADKCVLEFVDGLGNTYKFSFPAPLTAIFTDSDNVDPTHAGIIALIGSIQTNVRTRGGDTVGEFIRGYRVRSPRRV